ncbi:MAG: helix-hairpin-helix domain-containing protein [Candidatus Thorarchaeota archaeon]
MPELERLDQIPGVGSRLAQKLIDVFGSEEAALDIINNAQVATLASIPGVGKKKALDIVQDSYTIREGISAFEVLKTEDIRTIYNRILSLIQTYANSLFAKDKLSLYYPLPSSKLDIILQRLNWFEQAAELVRKCSQEQLTEMGTLLSTAKPLRRGATPPMATWRVILTDNDEAQQKMREYKADKLSRLIRLKPGEQLDEYLKSYDYVIAILEVAGMSRVAEQAGNLELLKSDFTNADVSPESIISFYATNHETILAICNAADALTKLPNTPALQRFIEKLDLTELNELLALIQKITSSGALSMGADEDYDRLRNASQKFEATLSETEIWANDRIRNEVSSSQVVLEGDQIISILEASTAESIGADQLRQYLPPQVFDILITALQDSEDHLAQLLQLKRNELEWVDGIFSQSLALPIQANRQLASNLQNNLRRAMHAREHQLKKEIASKLTKYEQLVKDAVQTLLDFDVFQAIGQFAVEYQLSVPVVRTENVGLAFEEGRNLFLMQEAKTGKLQVVPVSYSIGQNSWAPERTAGERVVLLSGANSGGKSCLLQSIAQVAILAQMGMLVPASKAEVGIFDELFYYAKSTGMLSAGAFESSLTNLANIVLSDASKLACFDEWEASTEPGAAAKVVAAVLELFSENPHSCVIFVSHLAEDILQLSRGSIRVDGIEATGLDPQLNLIVNRSPQFGKIAKSTPELIVERLYRSAKERKQEIFKRILELVRASETSN